MMPGLRNQRFSWEKFAEARGVRPIPRPMYRPGGEFDVLFHHCRGVGCQVFEKFELGSRLAGPTRRDHGLCPSRRIAACPPGWSILAARLCHRSSQKPS